MRNFFFIFCTWGATYIGLTFLTVWLPMEYISSALLSVCFAFWLERRVFHEDD